jgi:hypothetical protein
MPKLVNMKVDPAKEREKYATSAVVDSPRYPYGLCLHLDDEVVAKLGLDKLPAVGKPIMLVAKAEVTSVSANQYSNSEGKVETRESISLQITDMMLGPVSEEDDAAKSLYKG